MSLMKNISLSLVLTGVIGFGVTTFIFMISVCQKLQINEFIGVLFSFFILSILLLTILDYSFKKGWL